MDPAELRRVAFWARVLNEEELTRAALGTTLRDYPAGSYICHRGDRLDHWTGVVSGLIKISAISETGKAMTFAGIGSCGWFGEGTVLKCEPRRYDLVALRDTQLALMNRGTFMSLFETSVGFTRYLVHQLNERMGQFIATIEYDRILDPTTRVARHIAWLFNPVLYPGAGRRIEITQGELALLAGVSRPIVNKALQQLKDHGLIAVERGALTVRDLPALAIYGA